MKEPQKDGLIPQVFIVPRWSGTPHSDWYDWFADRVEEKYGFSVKALAMPHWNAPDREEAMDFMLKDLPALNEAIFLIGHSVGCLALLEFLHKKMQNNPTITVGGLVLVAAWFEVDDSWDTVIPWLNNDHLAYASLRENIRQKLVIISDNDPFTSHYGKNSELWQQRLGADVMLCPGRAHFNDKTAPDVLRGFCELIDASLQKK